MGAIEKMKVLGERFAEAQKKIQEEGAALFEEARMELFAAHPKLESFSWNQYTPYFNDGEPCEFRVGDYCIDMKFDGHEFEGEEGAYWDSGNRRSVEGVDRSYEGDREAALAACSACFEIVNWMSSNEQVALHAFGDHATVIVTADGVEVEEYDHE